MARKKKGAGIGVVSYVPRGLVSGRGKFVLFGEASGGRPATIVLSDYARDYQHRQIVARWESDFGTTPERAGLRVLGGGMWELGEGGKTLRLYGESLAYGGFDRSALAAGLVAGSVFGEQRILFERV